MSGKLVQSPLALSKLLRPHCVTGAGAADLTTTIFEQTLNDDADGNTGATRRQMINAAILTDPGFTPVEARVRFEAGSGEQLTITKAYIGHKAGAGDAYDFAATPVQLLFSASASVTIPAGMAVESDWAAFVWDRSSGIIVSYYMNGGLSADSERFLNSVANAEAYIKAAVDEAATVDVTGYSAPGAIDVAAINRIQVR